MSQNYDPYRLASPALYLVKIVIFLVLVALVALILSAQLLIFFWANPFINSLILLTLGIGIILSFRQVIAGNESIQGQLLKIVKAVA